MTRNRGVGQSGSRVRRALVIALAGLAACGTDRADTRNGSAITGAALDAVIAERVSVEEDRALFTLFAMLNAAGYDEENYVEMHPVRRAVRGALPRLLHDSVFARLEAFYKRVAGRTDLGGFAMAAKATTGPPEFAPRSGSPDSGALAELPRMLRTFHATFPVDSVYRTHLVTHRGQIDDFTALIRQKASMVFAYTRVRDTSELATFSGHSRVKLIPSLLIAYLRDVSFTIDSVTYRIRGPRPELAYDPHDFVHAVTSRISAAHPRVQSNPQIAEHVDESLVAAISLRLASLTSPGDSAFVRRNWTHGDSVLAPYFVEQLKQYERQRAPLREYYPRLFDRLDAWLDSLTAARRVP